MLISQVQTPPPHPGTCLRGQLATEQTPALTLDAVQTGAQEKVPSWPHVSLAFLGLQCKGVSLLQARNETKQPAEQAPKG